MTQLHEQKVREFYDAAGPAYERFMGHAWHHGLPEDEAAGLSSSESAQRLNKHLVAASGLQLGEHALVFGSGIGGEVLNMAVASGAHFTGVSNNDYLTRRATEIADEAKMSHLCHFQTIGDTDYKDLGPEESLDAVFFYESVCHLPDKQAFFTAAYRVLKPGRRLLGLDWLQRPFGEFQAPEEIERIMTPVNETFCIPEHGTVAGYRAGMEKAGFRVDEARDLYFRSKCWGSTPSQEKPLWLNYDGDDGGPFREQKRALDAAREAGVFTVGIFIGTKE